MPLSPVHLIAAGVFILLKYVHVCADTDDLQFLLAPVSQIVAMATNSVAVYSPENGYFHASLDISIDKSCSGLNFWILCFIMGVFRMAQSPPPLRGFLGTNRTLSLGLIPCMLLLTWAYAIFVNTSRILTSVFLQQLAPDFMSTHQHWTHQAMGISIYLFFLVLFYLMLDQRYQRQVHAP